MKRPLQMLLTAWLALLASCNQETNERSFKIMLKGLLRHNVPEVGIAAAAKDSSCLFLDARERSEFEVSHIRNARWVGFKDFDLSVISSVSKDQPIIVYCSIGYRSEKIAEKLVAAGYRSVHNLYGGIFGWVNEGLTVYRNGIPTNDVHAYNSFWSKWLIKGQKVYD